MTQSKHTTGIWFVNHESKDVGDGKLSIEVDSDYFIAQVDEGICQEANARLIAAAPELLEALQEAIDCGMVPVSTAKEGGACAHSRQVLCADMIRAAISKATGA